MIPDSNLAWKERAESVPLLTAAKKFGAKLRKTGSEWVGPCCYCGGNDRLGINPTKGKWVCRGFGGGSSVVSLAMHLGNLSFKGSIEMLTGEPCPTGGHSAPLSEEDKAARASVLSDAKARERADRAKQLAYEDDTRESALRIWNASTVIDGTLAQTYLFQRGIPLFESSSLRFHPALPYPNKPKPYPALICRVDDMGAELCAVWRIYLRADGRKADLPAVKLGLGPAGGGAVRIGGIADKIAIAEGIETALAFWTLTGRKFPCWASLSTSGMVGIELPLRIQSVLVVPDGDPPMRKKDGEYVPAIPAGRRAAETLRGRLTEEGVKVSIAAEPPPNKDYCDLLLASQRDVA